MYPCGFTAQVTGLSPRATEKVLHDFFFHCGPVQNVEIIRSGNHACTAYVTFNDAYALETAILLSGATIVDQRVCITHWGSYYLDDSNSWNYHSWQHDHKNGSRIYANQLVSSPGEAITVTQEVVKTMLAKGYVLGKDALVKAKAFDDSFGVSATAAAKLSELSKRIGLTDNINTSMETVKYIDEKYHVSEITRSAAFVTGTAAVAAGRTAIAAATAVVNSTYFARGAQWVSHALIRAAQAAADLGSG